MFTSLRSRLWLSYALVTLAALAVVAIVLLVFVIQNPSTYRQASAKLTIVASLLRKNETQWIGLSASDLETRIEQVDQTFTTRIVIYNADRQVMDDSKLASQPVLPLPRFPRLRPYSILRDANGNYWLYMLRHLNDGCWLLLAVPRPVVPLLTILTDELMLPILGGAVIALVISLLVAFWLARWIGDPLQRIVLASHRMPSAEVETFMPSGPHEVMELARAFNALNLRVQTSKKSQRDFVANVSHELKTPLTSIQGFSQALIDGTAATPEAQKQAAHLIYTESIRMHRMVLDLLDLARLDAGTFDLQVAPLDLAALLKNIVEKFSPQARASQIDILVETSPLPTLSGDGDRLAQVFTNLVDNALKFTPSGGRITLRTSQVGQEVLVDVIDTGVGISPQDLPHIFDRFYQTDPSRTGGGKHGSGLGLAIVKEIMATHGGKISARSQLGTGSTFTVSLPLSFKKGETIAARQKSDQVN
jgi:two-component system OmpR family sensor kinase